MENGDIKWMRTWGYPHDLGILRIGERDQKKTNRDQKKTNRDQQKKQNGENMRKLREMMRTYKNNPFMGFARAFADLLRAKSEANLIRALLALGLPQPLLDLENC